MIFKFSNYKEVKNMNYGKMVEDSFGLSWKYKSLWFFGLFAGSSAEYNFSYEPEQEFDPSSFDFESTDMFFFIFF